MDHTEVRRQQLKDTYYFLCECARCLGKRFHRPQIPRLKYWLLFFFHSYADEKEPIEMNSAACFNSKCNGVVNLADCPASRMVQCPKCSITIPPSHIEAFKDVMATTRPQVEKMKNFSVACKRASFCNIIYKNFRTFTFCTVLIPMYPHRSRRLRDSGEETERHSASVQCVVLENIGLLIRECHCERPLGRSLHLWHRIDTRFPVRHACINEWPNELNTNMPSISLQQIQRRLQSAAWTAIHEIGQNPTVQRPVQGGAAPFERGKWGTEGDAWRRSQALSHGIGADANTGRRRVARRLEIDWIELIVE